MKRTIFFLALFLIFISGVQIANAQEPPLVIPNTIDYQLPHPGLLPDQALYFLKAFRDKLVELMISDPKKRVEFNLLQADKRLSAGIYLSDRQNFVLAQSTISKGENYLENAIKDAIEAKKQGIDLTGILQRLSTSAAKHYEVVNKLSEQAPEDSKAMFNSLKKRIEDNKRSADLLLSQ